MKKTYQKTCSECKTQFVTNIKRRGVCFDPECAKQANLKISRARAKKISNSRVCSVCHIKSLGKHEQRCKDCTNKRVCSACNTIYELSGHHTNKGLCPECIYKFSKKNK